MKKVMLLAALALPIAAFAHAHLESSVPGKGSTVQASPGKVELVFNEPVGLTALKLQKKGEAARDLAPPARDSPSAARGGPAPSDSLAAAASPARHRITLRLQGTARCLSSARRDLPRRTWPADLARHRS